MIIGYIWSMLVDFKIPSPPFTSIFTDEFVGRESLSKLEELFVERAVEQRVKHFSTGRLCAKKALESLNITDVEILMNEDKAPVWPEGVVGSISHSKSMAGAVVAFANKVSSIGLDIETIGGVNPDMWDMLFLASEQAFLQQFTGDKLTFYTTLLFSGKEAFYKFQHPLTKTFLDFTDVAMNLIEGQFEIAVLKDFPGKELLPVSTPIYFTQQGNQLITLCYHERV